LEQGSSAAAVDPSEDRAREGAIKPPCRRGASNSRWWSTRRSRVSWPTMRS